MFDDENTFPTKDIRPVGSFIIDYYLKKAETTIKSELPRIIITFQDGIIGDELAKFVESLVTINKGDFELLLQVRRTPVEYYQENFPGLKNVSFSKDDFYASCISCAIHATVYSTTAIEALSLGRPNILINLNNLSVEQLGNKIGNNSYSIFVKTPMEFIDAISKLKNVNSNEVIESNKSNISVGYKKNISQLLIDLGYNGR